MKKNHLAAIGLTAGLLGGGAAGLALGVPGLAGAQSTTSTTTAPSSSGNSGTITPADKSGWMKETLDGLVAKGTITQAQADEVLAALRDAKPEMGPGRGHRLHLGLEAAASALGMTEAELRTELRDGKTIADVAKARNVDLQKVIDAIVGSAKTRLAQAVTDGKLTQAQADERIANLQDDVTKLVNGELRGPRDGGWRGGKSPSTTTPSPTTTTS